MRYRSVIAEFGIALSAPFSSPWDRPQVRAEELVAAVSKHWPEMGKLIIHLDMDAFYASVEQRDDPQLRGKPVVVGPPPGGRGVVSAASYEAREYGVRSAMPSAQARRLCPDTIFVPVNMSRYQEVSAQVMAILGDYTPLVEQISVDEAFLDVTGSTRLFGDVESMGRNIKGRIHNELQLTASVGIAANKFVAKVASDHGKPDGFVVVPEGQEAGFLEPLPVARLWGVGAATEKRLRQLGVRTIGQLARHPKDLLTSQFGAVGTRLYDLARGIDDRPVETGHEAKSVSAETTYQQDTRDSEVLLRTLLELAETVGARLRSSSLRGRTVQLKLRFEDFQTITRHRTLDHPTNADQTIYATATELLREASLEERRVRLLGVGVSNFQTVAQASLFDSESAGRARLDEAVDSLRQRFGDDKVKRGRLVDD